MITQLSSNNTSTNPISTHTCTRQYQQWQSGSTRPRKLFVFLLCMQIIARKRGCCYRLRGGGGIIYMQPDVNKSRKNQTSFWLCRIFVERCLKHNYSLTFSFSTSDIEAVWISTGLDYSVTKSNYLNMLDLKGFVPLMMCWFAG